MLYLLNVELQLGREWLATLSPQAENLCHVHCIRFQVQAEFLASTKEYVTSDDTIRLYTPANWEIPSGKPNFEVINAWPGHHTHLVLIRMTYTLTSRELRNALQHGAKVKVRDCMYVSAFFFLWVSLCLLHPNSLTTNRVLVFSTRETDAEWSTHAHTHPTPWSRVSHAETCIRSHLPLRGTDLLYYIHQFPPPPY